MCLSCRLLLQEGKGIEHGLSFHHEETGTERALAAEDPVTFRLGHRRTTIHRRLDMCRVCALSDRGVPYMYHYEAAQLHTQVCV